MGLCGCLRSMDSRVLVPKFSGFGRKQTSPLKIFSLYVGHRRTFKFFGLHRNYRGSPSFYVSRCCARAITSIKDHQRYFFNKSKLKNQQLIINSYNNKERQGLKLHNKQKISSLKELVQEDYTLFYNSWKIYKFLNVNFPHIFRIVFFFQFTIDALK